MVDRLIIDEWIAKAENDFEFARMVFSDCILHPHALSDGLACRNHQ